MLKEYLLEEKPKQAIWNSSMPGVQVCCFALANTSDKEMMSLPLQGEPMHFETFFCLGGHLIAEPMKACPIVVHAKGVFLLSAISQLRSLKISKNLHGILIAVDAITARDSLFSICSTMGLTLDTAVVRQKMEARHGCAVLANDSWTKALFDELGRLSTERGGKYCVFKAVELLYLLCASDPVITGSTELHPDAYRSYTISRVRAYLETHLEERQTIEDLCRQFFLSPTSLKAGFRRMYGQPIHRWLTQQRMECACKLMRSSDLPILKIAQAVGYDSTSQFSAAFKQHCGMTPGQYKKMSDTDDLRLF